MSTTLPPEPPAKLEIGTEAAEAKITDESIAAARRLIGAKLRPEQYLRDASMDSITIFANGIGDLNPLYRDVEYARWTRFGGLISHPCFPWTHHWPGRSYWGLPGVHGFGIGIDCEFFRNVRPGDRVSIWNRVDGYPRTPVALLGADGHSVSRVDVHEPARRSVVRGLGPHRASRAQGLARQRQIQRDQAAQIHERKNSRRSTARC